MNNKISQENNENTVVQVNRYEFFQVRALCDEIMSSLCQAKALLEPVSDDDFFQRLDVEVLRHYFYALDTIIDHALEAKDEITLVIDGWEKRAAALEENTVKDRLHEKE